MGRRIARNPPASNRGSDHNVLRTPPVLRAAARPRHLQFCAVNASVVTGLLERERELAALTEMIESAREGTGAAALIEGEAGIGKTALLAAACARASDAGMRVLTARAGELESEFAWGVVRQLFDAAVARAPADERSSLLEGAAALARPALGIEATEAKVDASYATLHGLYWLNVNLAERGPLLLAIDDLHWADGPSLRFVAHLLPRIAELPMVLLLAGRPAGGESGSGGGLMGQIAAEPTLTTIHPAALSPEASGALVRAELSREAGEDFCSACHEMSGGNPFLLHGLLVDLADEDGGRRLSVDHVRRITPAAVSGSVLLRLTRLPEGAPGLARAVAILGARAELRPAGRLAGLEPDDAAQAAGALIRAGILAEDEEALVFVHPLVRAAVLGDLPGPERGRWHHRAARLLADGNAPLEQVASHLVEAPPSGEGWVVGRLREAAADAWTRGAPDIAADYLRRAMAEPPSDETRSQVLFELGQLEAMHDPGVALAPLTEALKTAPAGRRRAEVALVLGDALTFSGRFGEAIEVLGDGIAQLGDVAPELLAPLEAARLSAARWEPTAQEDRRRLVAEVRRRAARGERLDPLLHAPLGVEAAAEGVDLAGAAQHARATLAVADRFTQAEASTVPEAILVLVFAELADEAKEASEDWLALARRRGWPLGVAFACTAVSLAALYRGDISEAVASGREATAPGAEVWISPVSVGFLVEALVQRGEADIGLAELAQRGLDGDLPFIWPSAPLFLARGHAHAAVGDHPAAIADLRAIGELAEIWRVRNPAMMPWRSSLARSLAAMGARDEALQLAHEEVELARRWGASRAIGVALSATGVVEGGEKGIGLLREAVEELDRSSAPLELARARTELGATLRRAGHRAEAREHLRNGLDLAHHTGGLAVADRARAELVIAGAKPRRDALRGRDALTASELRVAQLAAEGRSNREIAEALFVTLRTVEAHLTSTYSKLDITSRRDLATALGSAST